MPSKFVGRCCECRERYEKGDPVVLLPPKGARRRWLVWHSQCDPQVVKVTRPRWMKPIVHHYEWMTPQERVMYRDACSKGMVAV